MNRLGIFVVLVVWALACSYPLSAQHVESPDCETKTDKGESSGIEPFLMLTDQELDELIVILQSIRQMPHQQRIGLAQTAQRLRAMPDEQRRNLRQGSGRGAYGRSFDSDGWRDMMHQLTPGQRLEIQIRLMDTPTPERPSIRQAILEEWRSQQPSSR